MKKFKTADAWVSIVLIAVFTVASIIKGIETLIIGYLVVGGWQVISMLVHAFTRTFTRPKGIRNVYHWISFISVITMPVGSVWVLVFTAPFMAIFYTWLCYEEVKKMNERPLAILK